jgi:hypothetical protein
VFADVYTLVIDVVPVPQPFILSILSLNHDKLELGSEAVALKVMVFGYETAEVLVDIVVVGPVNPVLVKVRYPDQAPQAAPLYATALQLTVALQELGNA